MERQIFYRYVFDLLLGALYGGLMLFSLRIHIALWAFPVISILMIIDTSIRWNKRKCKFSKKTLLFHFIITFIGGIISLVVLVAAFR